MWLKDFLKDLISAAEDRVAFGVIGSMLIIVIQLGISIHSSFWLNVPYDLPAGWVAAIVALFTGTMASNISSIISKKSKESE